MRTTLNIDDTLLREARLLAARERTTLTRLIEEGLAERLHAATRQPPGAAENTLPLYHGKGGLRAGIQDPRSQRLILDALDEPDPAQ